MHSEWHGIEEDDNCQQLCRQYIGTGVIRIYDPLLAEENEALSCLEILICDVRNAGAL
jgi:hypothetical protein